MFILNRDHTVLWCNFRLLWCSRWELCCSGCLHS